MFLKDSISCILRKGYGTILRTLLLLNILIYYGCKKEVVKNVEPQHTYRHEKIDSSIFPLLFDSGSYWIYKDTSNNYIDSIILIQNFKSGYPIPQGAPSSPSQGDVECFYMKYYSSYTSFYFHEQLFANVISRGLYHGGYIFISTKQIGDHASNAEISEVIDSMIIENKTYHNVTKMEITGDYYIKGNHNFYYADSIGIIRKDSIVNDTIIQTWNLLRHSTIFYNYQ